MKNQLLPLFLIMVLAVSAASWVLYHQHEPEARTEQVLFPELRTQASSITQIKLQNNTGVLLHAQRRGDSWYSLSSADAMFPVNNNNLSNLLVQLRDARLLEAKTANPARYAKLGVDSLREITETPSKEDDLKGTDIDAMGTLITLSGAKTFQVILGNTATSGLGNYARVPNNEQAWLLDQVIELPENSVDWLVQPLLDIQEEEITRVSRIDESGWQIQRNEETGELVLQPHENGHSLRYDGVLDAMLSNITSLRFDAIAAREEISDINSVMSQLLIQSQRGDVELRVFESEDSAWLTFDTLNENWQHLTQHRFGITEFTARQLSKSMEDFLPEAGDIKTDVDADVLEIDEGNEPSGVETLD
ncbi:DUF4340 domain-containing protein [Aestuariibacter sp. AA17]|uniref:DUF4340 domain-containing protein n=1 Tax=Fluctibacter corallii TaxID=2984329 RepID=A0ABT3A8T4_9ALTE|nr:DUF4340 domain-containing protein [Aestuariibacter sp. AA17]MCV2885028.1 DUF4340 domain-containing protein [Aestuariibacter sp. AA17]